MVECWQKMSVICLSGIILINLLFFVAPFVNIPCGRTKIIESFRLIRTLHCFNEKDSSASSPSHELLIGPHKLIRYRYKKCRTQYKTDLLNNQWIFNKTLNEQISVETSPEKKPAVVDAINNEKFDDFNKNKDKISKRVFENERSTRTKTSNFDNNENNHHKKVRRDGLKNLDKRKMKNKVDSNISPQAIVLPAFEEITIADLSELVNISGGELIRTLMSVEGVLVSLSQKVSRLIATKLLDVLDIKWKDGNVLMQNPSAGPTVKLLPKATNKVHAIRSPIVTIMGHVDHGKTTLLDYIRSSNVVATESGGITQAISVFNVPTRLGRNITFLDTPGHAAFKEMRARGTKVTDIVVLVIAADDGIMDQTIECINAARESNCPIVVAINKIDKYRVGVDAIKTNLLNLGVVLEEFGGDVQCSLISAKSGMGIDDLLQKILLQADVMELKMESSCPVEGSIIESAIEKGRGITVTAVVQKGELKVGDLLVAGPVWGRVKLLMNERNEPIQVASSSMPVKIIGFEGLPRVGERMIEVANEDEAQDAARRLSLFSKNLERNKVNDARASFNIALSEKEKVCIPILLKADVVGSLEAIQSSLENITQSAEGKSYRAEVVYANLGTVSKSDIQSAAATKSTIVAFKVDAPESIIELGRSENVEVIKCDVLYDVVDYVTDRLNKQLEKVSYGDIIGTAEVKKIFNLGKGNKVAGCSILSGKIMADKKVRVLRQKTVLFCGKLSSLKVLKNDVSEVVAGNECGIVFDGFNDIAEYDMIECLE